MKCRQPEFLNPESHQDDTTHGEQPALPDTLTDCLTGREMPFSNRDHIRQKIIRFLVEDKGYAADLISVDRAIRFVVDGQKICSLVDISISLAGKTCLIWKCASGSLVSRHRQIIASARLLEDYRVPYAAVTNGKDIELLDTGTEKVISSGFRDFPTLLKLSEMIQRLSFKTAKRNKIPYEQRILYTYDAISCSVIVKD